MKTLTEEQRKRLELFAREEFDMRWSEIAREKQEQKNTWVSDQVKRMQRGPAWKRYMKATKEQARAREALHRSGFNINTILVHNKFGRSDYQERPVLISDSPKHRVKFNKFTLDQNEFTRAKNQILTAIWSMNKEYDQCVALIKAAVKKLS